MSNYTCVTVNSSGRQKIRDFLLERSSIEHLTETMLTAWASEAERRYIEHDVAYIELPRRLAKSGRTETLDLGHEVDLDFE